LSLPAERFQWEPAVSGAGFAADAAEEECGPQADEGAGAGFGDHLHQHGIDEHSRQPSDPAGDTPDLGEARGLNGLRTGKITGRRSMAQHPWPGGGFLGL